jgi:folylpolyglutamate synthase
LTIVSHLFKKTRLVDLHCNAIGFPREAITFLGTDPPRSKWQWTETLKLEGKEAFFKRKEALAGAYKAEEQWRDDPHGISELLAGKRKARNVWGVDQKLFLDDARRKLSGVETVFLPDGTESLAVGGRRPWKVEPVDPWEKMRSW